MSTVRPERPLLVALLALIPVVVFALRRSPVVALSVVSVLIIGTSIYTMMGADEDGSLPG